MKKLFIPILFLILTLTSCELFYEEVTYNKINMITIGLDYSNTYQLYWSPRSNSYEEYDFSLDATINDATDVEASFEDLSNNRDIDITYTGYSYLQEGASYSSETISDEFYPSKEHIITALENLSDISDDNTINIIYYSGHGTYDVYDSFTTYDYDGAWVLATTDTDTGESDFSTEDQLLSIEQIYELLEDVEGYTVIISDSCYSGNFYQDSEYSLSEDDFSLSAALEKLFSSGSDDSSIFFISASSNDESSYEFPDGWNSRLHGVFTYALLEGLGWDDDELKITEDIPPAVEDGILSLDSIVSYIDENLDYEYFDYYDLDSQELQTSGWRYDLVLFEY
ncbi:MAG: caspase family protein [Pleomorphochaeta sp.]